MDVVVTGGAGFIASHLVKKLLSRGNKVSVFDDLSTGNVRNVPAGAHLIVGSVLDKNALSHAFQDTDYVFHLAAIASVPLSVEEPELTHRVNVEGTRLVLEAASEAVVKKVIFASSSSVYGDSAEPTQDEDTSTNPLSPYARSKLEAEVLCSDYRLSRGLSTVCLRYFNVYGEGQNADSGHALVIPAFIKSARANVPLVIYGDGKQTRDFIYIEDVVDATIHAAESSMTGIYNIGSGESTSINVLAAKVIKLTMSNSRLLFKGTREGDPEHTRAGTKKVELAGFTPSWTLTAGLRRMIENVSS